MWLIILTLVVVIVYYFSMQGITCCNSGSSFALVRALIEKKKLSINEFIKYTKFVDYAKVKDKYYTDRPPGLAFMAAPIYALGGNVTLVSIISGVFSTVLVYLITLQLVNTQIIAFLTGIIFAFCTLNWRYSTLFLVHSLSTFLILLSVYLLILGYPIFLIGFIIGLAVMVEYTDAIFALGIGLYEVILGNLSPVSYLTLGFCVGIIPFLVYNKKCFGSPFITSYKYSAHFKWSNSFKTTFITPIFNGIKGILFFVKTKDGIKLPGGILSMSPILIFGVIGYFYLPLSFLILFLCLSLPLFLLMSKHKTYWGGGAGDYRYFSSIIPYITLPIGLSMKNLSFLWPVMLLLALVSFALVSARMVALTVTKSEIKKIDKELTKKIKSKRFRLIDIIKLKYLKKLTVIIIQGIFIRKIYSKKDIYNTKKAR